MSELLPAPIADVTPDVGLNQTWKELIAGSVGGIAQVMVGQPFDIVKVRIQTAPVGTYASPLECATRLLKNEGPLGFYKGTLTPLLGIGACVSIQFGALEWAKRMFSEHAGGRPLTMTELFAAGAFAGIANTVVASPVEHIRIRLQTQPAGAPLYAGPLDCARKIYASNGLAGIFKGNGVTIWREGLGYGSYFLAYEWLVERHMRTHNLRRDEVSPVWAMTYGATAGYALWFSCYPFDVIKSKLQADGLTPATRQYAGAVDAFRKVWARDGLAGFTRGLGPTLVRSPFANGATFVAFEMAMRAMS
ncbi:Mitochondrial carrier protein ymc2 [Cryptotrichosporon argae]